MKPTVRTFLIANGALALLLPATTPLHAHPSSPQTQESITMSQPHAMATQSPTTNAPDHSRDFEFLRGHWYVRNKRLLQQLQGSTQWTHSRGSLIGVPLLEGLGNYDELRSDDTGPLGVSIRFYNKQTRQWADYWVANRDGVMQPAVFGAFDDGVGTFFGDDVLAGKPIRIRQLWTGAGSATPRWEQAFSNDGGKSWETNWIMDFSRVPFALAN